MTRAGAIIVAVWRSPIVVAFCLTNVGWSLLWAGALHLATFPPPWFSAILFFAGLTLCAVHQRKQARAIAAARPSIGESEAAAAPDGPDRTYRTVSNRRAGEPRAMSGPFPASNSRREKCPAPL